MLHTKRSNLCSRQSLLSCSDLRPGQTLLEEVHPVWLQPAHQTGHSGDHSLQVNTHLHTSTSDCSGFDGFGEKTSFCSSKLNYLICDVFFTVNLFINSIHEHSSNNKIFYFCSFVLHWHLFEIPGISLNWSLLHRWEALILFQWVWFVPGLKHSNLRENKSPDPEIIWYEEVKIRE